MEILVKKRTRLEPIRLDMIRNDSKEIRKMLVKHLNLSDDQVFFNEMPVLLNFVGDLGEALAQDTRYRNLFFVPLKPQPAAGFDQSPPLIPQIQKKDLLLSYPYEDIKSYVHLLEEAATHPHVLSIKIALYRVARNSRIVDALIRAAENGKEVIAVVELRARFDEENNIDWSKRLQESGVSVIYGIENYKVHSKLMLITMRHRGKVSFITQIGTGNYNEKTAKLYTDLSFVTANEDIAINAQDIFKNLSMGSLVESSDLLMVAPLTLKPEVMRLIGKEISIARNGGKARLVFKLNSINDNDIMKKLIEASDAGVEVKLIVRGICCLSVEKTGPTRNMEILSIVGRYLEHSRIYMFGLGERQRIFISSADLMSRNTERRVEVAAPITDPDLKERLNAMIDLTLRDNVKARRQENGVYSLPQSSPYEKPVNSQTEQFRWAYKSAGNIFPPEDP
jgi:polyphosphate kinase